MKELKQLGKTITSLGQKNIPLLDLKERKIKHNKEYLLLNNAVAGKYSSDLDAICDLYEDKGQAYAYRMLKSRLKQKLYNHIYFINTESLKLKTAAREETECLDLIFKAYKLALAGDRTISIKLLKKALSITEKFEFTDLTIQCLIKLRLIYSDLNKKKEFHKIQGKLSHYNLLKIWENESSDLFFNIKVELKKSVRSRKKLVEKLKSEIPKLKSLWEKTSSFNIFENYYRLNVWYLELLGYYDEILAVTHETEEQLNKGVINKLRFDDRLNKYMIIYAYLYVRDFDNGLYYAAKYLDSFSPSSINWFSFMGHYFLLAMHAENYVLATDLINKVESNPDINKVPGKAVEEWHLYKAYLYFIRPEAKLLKEFNYQNFITSVPEYSKDKLGYNVAILILQFLHFLKENDYDALYYRMEALRKYSSHYFSDNANERSRYLFKLFMVLFKSDFDTEVARKKGQYYYKKLKNTPPPTSAYSEIEIIPYERLWRLTIKYSEGRIMA